jgi:hypothetical protein
MQIVQNLLLMYPTLNIPLHFFLILYKNMKLLKRENNVRT